MRPRQALRTLCSTPLRTIDTLMKRRGFSQDTLPGEYQLLPNSVDFKIPGFHEHYREGDQVLAPGKLACAEWYGDFVTRLSNAAGREFLPVCRMSDGEFRFLFGDQPPDVRLPLWWRLTLRMQQLVGRFVRERGFAAATAPGVSSGKFTSTEWKAARVRYDDMLRFIAERGVLAIHLSYHPRTYFQERYFPALSAWLSDQQIILHERNYVPFYFVYAAFIGPRRSELLQGKRLLLVHGAQGSKRARIIEHLRREGAAEIMWCEISAERSFYDRLDIKDFVGSVDLVLIGAGIGKPNILAQLAPLDVPAVDAGFLFEVWADTDKKWDRPFCVSDEDWDDARVRFLPPGWEVVASRHREH
jgi:hypothetical protein